MNRHPTASLLLAVLAACGVAEPSLPDLPPVTEVIGVFVGGDGFVRTAGRRLPLDLFVLELRQRVRPMNDAERGGIRVEIDVEPTGGYGARDASEKLVDQLQIMGIRNVGFS